MRRIKCFTDLKQSMTETESDSQKEYSQEDKSEEASEWEDLVGMENKILLT